MSEGAERRRLRIAWAVVTLVALAHRAALFLLHRADLDAFIDANASWYIYQNLPREMLHDHLLRSLLYLQQTPPASNVFMGLALKWFSWPVGCAYALIWLQTVTYVLATLLLIHVLALLYPGRAVLWTAIGLLFVINTDLVVLEYNSMGQTMYGPITTLLLLAILDRLLALRLDGRVRHAAAVGLAMGLLVLTRGTWSFFSVICLLLVAMFAPERRWHAVLACLLPIALLQGGWAVKNWRIYGVFSLTTTTWGGLHTNVGMLNGGLSDEFKRFRLEHVTLERGYPAWRVAAVNDPLAMTQLRPDIKARDTAIQEEMGAENPLMNTLTFRVICAEDEGVFLDFLRSNPGTMARKWWRGYVAFWQPIANYGLISVDVFAVGNHLLDSFDLPGIVGQLGAGTLPDSQYVTRGSRGLTAERKGRFNLTPTTLYTFRWTEPFVLMLNLVGVHLLLPLVAVLWLLDRIRRGGRARSRFDPLRMSALLVMAICYLYLATLVNLVETIENMRYRLEVEPMIWLITLICVTELAAQVRTRR